MEARFSLHFLGMQMESLELMGYDAEAKSLVSTVYSNVSSAPLPYTWEVDGDSVTIIVNSGPLDATFKGEYREDGTFSGGWRSNSGADETVNVPYDISGQRID